MTPVDRAAHLTHDELSSPRQMADDCREVSTRLGLERAARTAVAGRSPSLRYEDYPREVPKRDVEVSEAAARLAGALHLHLD